MNKPIIVNPRGTSGSGKTTLVRRVMEQYPERSVVLSEKRRQPLAYTLRRPNGLRPLMVLGHYETACGGCDTITAIDDVFALARRYASEGRDVLFEGLLVSTEFTRSAELARDFGLHILQLSTPLPQCLDNIRTRRLARGDERPLNPENTAAKHKHVPGVCQRLAPIAQVEVLCFDEALARAFDLLRLGAAATVRPDQARHYSTPRQNKRWDTPAMLTVKCFLRYHRRVLGSSAREAIEDLRFKMPWFWDLYLGRHGVDLTDEVLVGRFHTSTRDRRRAEWPDHDPAARRYWTLAGVIAKSNRPFDLGEIQELMPDGEDEAA